MPGMAGQMVQRSALIDDLPATVRPPPSNDVPARFRAMREEHFEFVWRSIRRLGVPEADTDDAVQQVFIIAAQKLDRIEPGCERSFLFGVALRVASHTRRTERRRGEVGDEALADRLDDTPGAEDLLEQRRARALLDEALDALPLEARAVFVLFELEELTLTEIADLLSIPRGTAASRLRRARELFEERIAEIRSRCER